MGKKRGAKSKKTRRNNRVKRRIMLPLTLKKIEKLNQINQMQTTGIDMLQTLPKNAFKYPNDPDAVFPQRKPQAIIDLRASSNVETLIKLEFEKTKMRMRKRGDVIISRTRDEMEKDLEEQAVMKQKKEEQDQKALLRELNKMMLKDELKQKKINKRKKNKGGMMVEEVNGMKINKKISKGRKRVGRKRKKDLRFR